EAVGQTILRDSVFTGQSRFDGPFWGGVHQTFVAELPGEPVGKQTGCLRVQGRRGGRLSNSECRGLGSGGRVAFRAGRWTTCRDADEAGGDKAAHDHSGGGSYSLVHGRGPSVVGSGIGLDRKSTRLNSSHVSISY